MTSRAPYASYATAPPQLIGGALCLDFVNTVQWRGDRSDPGERLVAYEEVVYWSGHAGTLGDRDVRRFVAAARRRPDEARVALDEAIALREALARLLSPRGHRSAADLGLVNGRLAAAPARAAIVPAGRGYAWPAAPSREALEPPLWPIVWSAVDLLTSPRLAQVQSCADPRCGWLFLDASRNKSRRWCAMENCGNRAKVRRHLARRRRAGT